MKKLKNTSKKSFSQMKFNDPRLKKILQFGGSLLKKSNAKTARPISTKHAMHVVLRSSQAKGEWSMRTLKNQKIVNQTLNTLSKRYGIKIYEFANVGNHLHILLKIKNRQSFSPFLKALTGTIALKVTGSSKIQSLKQKFWDYRPWTRIVEWKRAYTMAKDYVIQNHLEAIGYIRYVPRGAKSFLRGAPA